MYKKHLISIIAALLLMPAMLSAKGNITVKATLDSAYILMGKQTALQVNVVEDDNVNGYFISRGDTLTRDVEVIKAETPDTSNLGNGRREIMQRIIIQSFDSGLYTLPPLLYVSGNDTIKSNTLALKVIPVPVDTLKTIHDYADVANPNVKFMDYLPDFVVDYWWIFLLVILIAAGTFVWYKYIRGKKSLPLVPKKKPVPPYEAAISALNRLKGEKLCENGHEKEFYTRLTEILRIYLDKRFGINAMEMTSTQIMHSIYDNADTKPSAPVMKQILEVADFVKFAKVRPLPDDNQKAFGNAVKFVEDTKPAPVVDENEEKSTEKKDN